MNAEERTQFKERVRQNASEVIARADALSLTIKARALREQALKLWERGEGNDTVEALFAIAEATRIQTYLDMLRDPDHGMWECIALDKRVREEKMNRVMNKPMAAANTSRAKLKTRVAIIDGEYIDAKQYRLDRTLGYRGEVAREIHNPEKAVKLFFK